MKTHKIIFNNKVYTFSSVSLNKFFERMLFNENKNEYEKKSVISFITDKFCMKTYDELEYHEFLIDGEFIVSQLLCNIENIFGETIKNEYKQGVSDFLGEEVSEIDTFLSLKVSDALQIAKPILLNDNDLSKFKELLSVVYLYYCARFDYVQTIEDLDGFDNFEFVNGIGVKLITRERTIILKPIHSIHDLPIDQYIRIAHVLVPPIVLNALFRTVIEGYNESDVHFKESNFFKKFEQLTGNTKIRKIPEAPKEFIGIIEPQLIGKWYHIYKSNGFISMYHINIEWFKEDGTQLRSVVFTMNLGEYTDYENWGPQISKWLANETQLYIYDAYLRKDKVYNYQINEHCLQYNGVKYYSSYEEAAENID